MSKPALTDTMAKRFLDLGSLLKRYRHERRALSDAIAQHGDGESSNYEFEVKYRVRRRCVGKDELIRRLGLEKANKLIKDSTVRNITVVLKNDPRKKPKH